MLFFFFGALFLGLSDGARFDGSEPCSWLPDNNEGSSKLAVTCNVRLLDQHGANLTNIPQELTSRLKIQCSSAIFYESLLPSSLQKLHELEALRISNCKLLTIVPNAMEGLYNLKKLFVNSFNSEWGPSKNLELNSYSFHGLKELQVLDLAENNIRAVPEGVFCSLVNLQTLNLTRNRIRNSDRLGISEPECSSSELQNLDLSFNDIRLLGEQSGFGKLRRLQNLNLQFNNITEVSGESLAGLVSLKVLDLSNNKIGALPQGFFAGSPELKEIHLQNNSLYSLAKGLFHRLEQLLVLDLSGNQLTSNHVDNGSFAGLIRLIVLNLSHNALTRIDSRTFKDLYFLQILDLKNNSIGFIEDNAFLPLYNLHTLNLAENRLNTIGPQLFNGLFVLSKLTLNNNLVVSVDSRAFQNCSVLKELDLSSNALADVPEAIQELTFLKTLDLGENQISDFRNGSFKNLNQLTGLRLIDNTIGNLTRGMLWDLPNLQVLNLAKNKIQSIERGTFDRNTQIEAIRLDENFLADINGIFAELASLLWLNLSENHLVWFDYAFIPSNLKWLDIHGNFIEHLANYYKIQTEIGVKTLDASHNRITEITPMSIPNSVELLFVNNNFIKKVHPNTFLDKVNLARVDMYANDLVYLDITALRLADLPGNKSLPELYLGGNPFHCDCTMEWLQSINSRNNGSKSEVKYPQVMDLENVVCKMTNAKGMTHMPLSQAQASDFVCTYETHCFTLCHCCDFDACDCEMTCPNNCSCYHDQTWNTNVVDCSGQGASEIPQKIPMDATEVYLDGNYIKELQNHAFIGRKNLRNLFVNNSNVEAIQNSTFNSLHALQVLHLEDNNLRELKGYEFEHLDKLQELYLHNNFIARIGNRSFEPLVSLRVLRLDGNKLTVFPVWQFSWNRDLAQIMLANNPWSCRCKFLQELTSWVADNAVKVLDSGTLMCSIPEAKPARSLELDFNATVCRDHYEGSSVIDSMLVGDYWPMVVVTLCVVILMLLAVVLWFIFRDPVRVWLYSRYGVRLCNFRDSTSKQFDDGDKLYDAFVCYSPKDEEWVVHSLAAELEPRYQLCLHYRNIPTAAYNQHVLEASEASRRIVMVLTRNFLETEWARYDLRQAFHEALKGRVYKLVIVEDGPFNEALLDPDLRLYLKTAERVRWGERRFWERLKYALPSVEARGKINANYRRNINNYTIDSRVVPNGTHHSHHHFPEKVRGQGPPSPSMQMMPPPAYSAGVPAEPEDANYSSATTATPSPRPSRRMTTQEARPISDHIYSSIDSDYSTLERGASGRRGAPQQWRPPHVVLQSSVAHNGAQAYLV